MEMYGNVKCVTHSELVDGGVITQAQYINYTKRKQFIFHQRGGNGRIALIDYNSLPALVRQKYDEIHPDAEIRLKNQLMNNILRTDSKAIDFYRRHTLADGSSLTDKKQAEYILNAQVLNEMVRVEAEARAMQGKLGHSRPKVAWELAEGTCEKLRQLYGHTLPKSSRLREKLNDYKKYGYIVLVSQKNSNSSARKIGPREARLILRLRRSRVPVYTEAQIFEEFNRLAEESQWKRDKTQALKPIKSPNTLRNYLYAPEVMPLWYAAVFGMQAWKGKYTSLLKTEMPTMRDSLWYSDGTKLNLYYKNKDGKMCTTSVYEVMDAYSEVFLGYDIAPNENFDSQYRAFRMAVEVAGVRPYEIVNDNQGGHRKAAAQGFFDKIAVLRKPTMPYNGNSKTIESAFGRFQSQILHKIWHFTGQNVTTVKKNSHPNMEFIEQNAYALPTLEEVKQIYKECREQWNNAPHPATGIARIEMYRMSENPETQPVTAMDLIQMFWLKKPETVTYTNKGLAFDLNKESYEYDVYGKNGLRNEAWALRNTGRKFRIFYDPMDMTRIELWEVLANNELRYSTDATPKVSICRGTQERTEEQTSYMRRAIEQSKETMGLLQIATEEFDLDEKIAAELFGLSTPQPKNVSKEKMEQIRKDYEKGRRKAPISLPEKLEQEEDEDGMELAYSTLGGQTKELSNLTFDDVKGYEMM